jgi:hypothetical protein
VKQCIEGCDLGGELLQIRTLRYGLWPTQDAGLALVTVGLFTPPWYGGLAGPKVDFNLWRNSAACSAIVPRSAPLHDGVKGFLFFRGQG